MGRFPLLVLALLAACSSPPRPETLNAGIYAGALPATLGGGDERQVRLTLRPGGDAALQATFIDNASRFFAEGRWSEQGDRVVVDLAGERPGRVVFARSGPQLVAREWDRALWGEEGVPVLYRLNR